MIIININKRKRDIYIYQKRNHSLFLFELIKKNLFNCPIKRTLQDFYNDTTNNNNLMLC